MYPIKFRLQMFFAFPGKSRGKNIAFLLFLGPLNFCSELESSAAKSFNATSMRVKTRL